MRLFSLMFPSTAALLLLLPAGLALAQSSIYRCTNSEGKRTLQSIPCDNAPQAVANPPQQAVPTASAERARAVPGNAPSRETVSAISTQDAKQWAVDADVIVVSGYEAGPTTQVNVSHAVRPVVLVLTTYTNTQWKVQAAPGTRIKAIIVASFEGGDNIEVQAPPQVPVAIDKLPYVAKSTNIYFREMLGKLNARYGAERVLALRGSYTLPPLVAVSGPFVNDPNLTLEGIRPEVPSVRFSFNLLSIDGLRLPFTNTGPKEGSNYKGMVRGGTLGSPGAGPAVVGDDGRGTYFFEGNGSTLVWAPDGLKGKTQKVLTPPGLPQLSWGSGLAWNTRKGVLAIVSFGGEGYFYRYDTRNRTWLDSRSLKNRDLFSLAANQATGDYVALSDNVELITLSERGEIGEVVPLQKVLPDLGSTYDRGNGHPKNLFVVADGAAVAIGNVRNGTVTHIWTYDRGTRKAQLTYKAVE